MSAFLWMLESRDIKGKSYGVGANLCVRPFCPDMNQCHVVHDEYAGIQGRHAGLPLPQIIQWFKTMTTNEYIKMVKQNLLPPKYFCTDDACMY